MGHYLIILPQITGPGGYVQDANIVKKSFAIYSSLTAGLQIVFDECHKAKNLVPTGSSKPTKTGITVLELQKQLPKARVVYCSATGGSPIFYIKFLCIEVQHRLEL